ncbi:MAG: lysophospholipase [Rhodospirillaceae bacterium]
MAAMTAHDGIELRVRADEPASAPRARIVLIHGIGDQVDGVPYVTAAAALSARGFSVRRLELRGHGLSGGRRAYVPSWGDFRSDLGRFVDQTAAERPALPVFLAGVSMGGLIVTNYAVHRPEGLRGVIALAPALGDTGGSRVLLAMLPVLSRVVPALPIDPKLDLSRLTRDAGLQRAYVADPLYQRRVTPRIAAELLKAIAETRSRAAGFRVPLLILHGTADTLTSPSGSAEFFARAGVADKTYRRYEGAYHNLFVETNREEIYDDMAAWIDARAGAAP